ncbi:MAG TPA: DUF6232 family protein [Pilimelia sp.]|nr:DUF6232 family protein [Pilimelia sp.]
MARAGFAEIRINARTLHIDSAVYPLANIARVQSVTLYPRDPHRLRNRYLRTLVVGALLLGCLGCGAWSDEGGQRHLAAGALTAVGAGFLAVMVWLIRRARPLRPAYSLTIETAGSPRAALTSFDSTEIENVVDLVVAAIEHPPKTEIVHHIPQHVIVTGDQINQYGDHNIGRAA